MASASAVHGLTIPDATAPHANFSCTDHNFHSKPLRLGAGSCDAEVCTAQAYTAEAYLSQAYEVVHGLLQPCLVLVGQKPERQDTRYRGLVLYTNLGQY